MDITSLTSTKELPPVEIWLANLQDLEVPLEQIAKQHPLLSAEELKEFCDFEKTSRQRMRRTARMVLRLLLTRFFGSSIGQQKFEIGPHGRPTISGLHGDFNLAHAGGFALVAVGTISPLGVDIEIAREVRISPARRSALIAAAEEVSEGSPLPAIENARSLQAWTRLEALAKAEGLGIGRLLSRYGIWGVSKAEEDINFEKRTSSAVLDLVVGVDNMQAAVCLPKGVGIPEVNSLPMEVDQLIEILSRGNSHSYHSGVDLHRSAGQKVY